MYLSGNNTEYSRPSWKYKKIFCTNIDVRSNEYYDFQPQGENIILRRLNMYS
jgi:hypothetical protein